MATDLDKSVQTYTEQIESNEEAQDRKALRSERKQPKQALKKCMITYIGKKNMKKHWRF